MHYIKLNQRGLEKREEEGDRQRRETEIGLKHFDGKKRAVCLNERKVIRAFGYTDGNREWRGDTGMLKKKISGRINKWSIPRNR